MHITTTSIEFFRSIDALSVPRIVPSDADLRTVRLPGGLALPPSYEEWARTFGYGEVCKILMVQVPLPERHPDSLLEWSAETKAFFLESLEEGRFEFPPDGSPALI